MQESLFNVSIMNSSCRRFAKLFILKVTFDKILATIPLYLFTSRPASASYQSNRQRQIQILPWAFTEQNFETEVKDYHLVLYTR